LWDQDLARAAARFVARFPLQSDMVLSHAFEYLGILIGPSSSSSRWSAPIRNCLGRAAAIRSAGGGKTFSTLRHTASFDLPSWAALSAEARGIARVTSTPMRALPVDLLASFVAIGVTPAAPHLTATSMASQVRSAMVPPYLHEILRLVDPGVDQREDELLLSELAPVASFRPRWRAWWSESVVVRLARVLVAASGVPRAFALDPQLR
jgi:hypothetical protein